MSIDNGWNRADKSHEDDYEDGIARADAIGKLAEEYEKKLLSGESIFVDGVEWVADEMISESGVDLEKVFKALMSGDDEAIDSCRERICEWLLELAEEHIDNMEQDDD